MSVEILTTSDDQLLAYRFQFYNTEDFTKVTRPEQHLAIYYNDDYVTFVEINGPVSLRTDELSDDHKNTIRRFLPAKWLTHNQRVLPLSVCLTSDMRPLCYSFNFLDEPWYTSVRPEENLVLYMNRNYDVVMAEVLGPVDLTTEDLDEEEMTTIRGVIPSAWSLISLKKDIEEWVNKQGNRRCWYYPDIFRRIAEKLGIKYTDPGLPPLHEFQEGCNRYQNEEYSK